MIATEEKRDVPARYLNLGQCIREYVSEKGLEALKITGDLKEYLKEKNVENILIIQAIMLLEESNITNYFSQADIGISMIDVNNIVSCSEINTGLNRGTVKNILAALLYGIGLPTDIENAIIQTENGLERKDTAILFRADYRDVESRISEAVRLKDEISIKEVMPDLNRLADAGVPKALYWKGKCFYEGIGTVKDERKGFLYMKAAANAGCSDANAFLGDHYFDSLLPEYTTALGYYTEIGAVPLNSERQKKVKIILAAAKQNNKLVAMSGILLVLMYAFNVLMAQGSFMADRAHHNVLAIISSVLLTGLYGVFVYAFVKRKYDVYVIISVLMFLLFALFVFIAFV